MTIITRLLPAILAILIFTDASFSQTPDEFNPNANGLVSCIAVQVDGKIIIGGDFSNIGGVARSRIARLNAESVLDTDFNPNANGMVYSLAVQADGKILIAGDFTAIGGVARNRIARLNADGTLDAGFNPNANRIVGCFSIQADGKILIGGDFTTIGGVARNRIARLNTDGTLDADFNSNANSAVRSLALQADGKILIGGYFTSVGGVARNRIARMNPDGGLDVDFNPNANNPVYSLAVQADGKILIGGVFTTIGGVTRNCIARLNTDGVLDPGFNPNVASISSQGFGVESLAVQADGKILTGGRFFAIDGVSRNNIARLNAGGTLDTSFNPNAGGSMSTFVPWLALQVDGKLLIGGSFTTVGGMARNNIARLSNNIAPTQTLAVTGTSQIDWTRGGSAPEVEQVTFDVWNGNVWISQGAATWVAGGWRMTGLSLPASSWVRARARVASSSSNGSHIIVEQIATYGAGTFPDIAVTVGGIAISSGNDTLDFGSVDWADWENPGTNKTVTITNEGDAPLSGIALTLTGPDAAEFTATAPGVTTLAPGEITTVNVQFLVQGGGARRATLSITSNDGDESPFTIACMGTGVHQDPDFNPIASSMVQSMALQSDGKILIGGDFTTIGGVARNRIARLKANGSLDAAFNPNASGWVYDMAVQADGKILIGGNFTTVGGVARNRIARLNADGTLDADFNPNANGPVNSLAFQTDGKILMGGDFWQIGGISRNRIARLNADGSLDSDFNPSAYGNVLSLALQADGKILIGGDFTTVGGVARNYVARLNIDGSLDADFDPNANSAVRNFGLQADGKILIGGGFTAISGVARNRIARLHIDGTLDADFNPNASNTVRSLALQAGGNILIGGDFTTVGGVARNCIARLNADGTLDDGFNPNASGSTIPSVYSMALQVDGKMLIGGSFTTIGGVTRNHIARLPNNIAAVQTLTVSGTSQIEWTRGGSTPEVEHCSFDAWNGSTWINQGAATRVAGGWLMTGLSLPASSWVRARAWASGSSSSIEQITSYGAGSFPDITVTVDGTTQSSGSAAVDFGTVDWATSGPPKIFTITNAGDAPLNGFALTMAGPDAAEFTATSPVENALDPGETTTFTVQFSPLGGGVRRATLSITSNDADESPFTIDCSGTVIHQDPGFTPNPSTWVSALALQADGKILIGGDFWYVNGIPRYRIARLNGDGSFDANFNPLSPYFNNVVYCLAVQNDGKILIGGQFTAQDIIGNPSVVPHNYIARLHADGTLDTSFNSNPNGRVSSFALQTDGKIIIQGNFSTIDGVARKNIARLHADGSLDTEFDPNANSTVASMAVQDDGKIIIGGWFGTIGGVSRKYIARLNADGSLDTGFNPNINNTVESLAVQADGKILMFGYSYDTWDHRITRLNTDGSLDNGFNSYAISHPSVKSMVLQADGKILVGGLFTTIGEVSRNRIARLNSDGSLDTGFNPIANSWVRALAFQADGKILTGGSFTTIGGVLRNNIARLPNNIAAVQTLTVTGTSQIDWTRGGSVQEVGQVTFDLWNGSAWVSQGPATRVESGWRMTGLSLPASSWVRARARTAGGENNGSAGIVEQITSYGAGDYPDIKVEAPEGNELITGAGTVDLGTASERTFTIRNTGTANLSNLAISKDGPSAGDFTVGAPGLTTLDPGASTTFTVRFTPAVMGTRFATLRIASNDADESPFEVSLTGNGGTAQQVFEAQMAAAGLSELNADPGEMPFKDGVSNLLKYAFNMNVISPDVRTLVPEIGTAGLPVMRFIDGATPVIRYEFIRKKNSGLSYAPLQSSDLSAGTWIPMTGTTAVTSIDSIWERVVIEQALQTVSPLFLKVQVVME